MRVGLIGAGNMGNRFGPRILRAGHHMLVHDLRREAAEALCAVGAEWVSGPEEMARGAEVILTSLPSPEAVEKVAFALIPLMKPGSTYVDMSTSTPWLARDIHAAFKQAGLDALDAPLSNGGVFIGVGGDEAAYERCRPVLEAAGEHVFRVGGPGMGQAAKLVRQYVAFSSFMAEAEGLVIAAKAGLDPGKMATFLGQTLGSSPHRERVIGALLQGDFGDPETAASKLDIVAKDLALAVELARRAGSPANVGLAASDVLQRGQAQGWGRLNFWSAVQVIEEMAGAQVRDTYNRSDAI